MTDVNELQGALQEPVEVQRQLIQTWLALIESNKRTEQAAQNAADKAKRAETAAKNQIRIHEALLSEIGRVIQQNTLQAAAAREFQEEVSAKLEHLNYVLSLILEVTRLRLEGAQTKADKERLAQLIEEIKAAEFDLVETEEVQLRKLIKLHRQNLGNLQIQAAGFGASMTVPLYLLNQMAAEEEKIADLEAKLHELMASR
jgi:hypothetical protein